MEGASQSGKDQVRGKPSCPTGAVRTNSGGVGAVEGALGKVATRRALPTGLWARFLWNSDPIL